MSGRAKRRSGGADAAPRAIDYDEAKRLAAGATTESRAALAARGDVQPEILYFLAGDAEPAIRRAAAANDATPVHAGLLLARDADEGVRCSLAERIARLVPELDADASSRLGAVVNQVIETLAQDQLGRVRRLISEAVRESDVVPPHIVAGLARDGDARISAPVLESSPLLDDDVLIEIIETNPASAALVAISRRAGLGAPVADAIVAADDIPAITELLCNHSAQIREETLDRLVDRADAVPQWHGPLVRRPVLSARAVRCLSEIVARSLLTELSRRGDLDAETAAELGAQVAARLDEEAAGSPARSESDGGDAQERPDARAERLFRDGALDEAVILDTMRRGDRAFVLRALSLLSGLAEPVVDKAVSLASAKGVTAIAWKAGLAMRAAVQLQLRLARIPPPKVLHPRNGDAFPLTEDEMHWQIEFFGG